MDNSSKKKAKEAGIIVAVIGAMGAVCAAGLNSGAYLKLCPATVCPTPSSGPSGAPPSSHGATSPTRPVAEPANQGSLPQPPKYNTGGNGSAGRPGNNTGNSGKGTGKPVPGSATKGSGSGTSTKPIGDFSVSLLEDYGCILRSGEAGYWDLDIWYTINWVSPENHPMPTGNLRLVTDLERSKDWSLNQLGSPGGYLDTYVDADDRLLGRFATVRATIRPDREVPETSTKNNSMALTVDLRGGLPPANTNLRVPCSKA